MPIFLMIIAAALGGCSTAAERQQIVEAARAEVIANAKSICANIGYKLGTPEFTACVEKMFSDAVQVEQQNISRAVAAYRRPVMCNRVGSTTICN